MKNIKAIIFDAYGTLFDVNSAAEKCKNKIGDKWEPFANYWRTIQLEYTWLRSLMNRHEDFWQITEDSLDKSMKIFKINASMKNELLDLYRALSIFPEVSETLNQTGVEKLFKEQIHGLSGGEFQRVLLARAIAKKPELLVLDEPVQGVDFNGEIDLYNIIKNISANLNCGILLVSHDLHFVMSATDHVVCLNGHICCSGKPSTVIKDKAYIELFGEHRSKTLTYYQHDHDHTHNSDGSVSS